MKQDSNQYTPNYLFWINKSLDKIRKIIHIFRTGFPYYVFIT